LEQVIDIQKAAVKKACNGDAKAQAWLYEQYSKAMYNICTRMTGNQSDAEDLLQDCFVIAFSNLHQLKVAEQFGGWLKRIVVNECIRFCKKNIRWEEWDADQQGNLVNEEMEWWKTIDFKIIHATIKQLPDGCRQVFNLYVFEDYSHKQIAESMGISESTSKSQYQRARALLKQRIYKQVQIHG
jgi:RNA polymerase sigma-70 factor (ECF subfamily)